MTGIILKSGGKYHNTGTVSGYAYGIEIYGGAGTVINGGSIGATGKDGVGILLEDGGSVTNDSGGSITGALGVEIYGGIGTVINSGSISATAVGLYAGYGVLLKNGGSITNKSGGSIAGSNGVGLQDGGSVANAANASISGFYRGVTIAGAVGTVTNSGLIAASHYIGVVLRDGGTVTNAASGTISGNDGTIGIYGGIGHVTNAGTVSGAGDVVLGAGGTVANTGTIGEYVIIKGGSGKVTNSGYIGIRVELFSGGTVTNSGTIEGGVLLASGGTVANSAGGTIHGGYTGVELGYDGSSYKGGGVFSNAANAAITGASGVYAGGSAASVTNSGSIKGVENETHIVSGVTEILGDGVSLNAGGSVGNESGAYISGVRYGVYVNGGSGTVANAGTIATLATTGNMYAVKFAGAGANKLILETGSVLDGSVGGSTATGATNELVLEGAGTADNAFLNFDALVVRATGAWTLGGALTIGKTTVSTGELEITGALTTKLDESAGSTVRIAGKETLTLDGGSTLSGTTEGNGTLAITAGVTTLASGAVVTFGEWSVLGNGAGITIEEPIFYSGSFVAGLGALINLSGAEGDFLTLRDSAVFSGATLAGSQTLTVAGTTKVKGLTVGGDGGFVNEGFLTQSALVTLGDSSELYNLGSGTWDISNNDGIALDGSKALLFFNDGGLFEKTGGAFASDIAPAFDNAGAVLVSSGALDFEGAVTGSGVDTISGAAKLEFDSTVASTQTIDFTGADGVLDLGSPSGFSGALSGFDTVGSSDAVELLGKWSISGFSTSSSQSTLTLSDGSLSAALAFDGTYEESSFGVKVGSGHTTITYS